MSVRGWLMTAGVLAAFAVGGTAEGDIVLTVPAAPVTSSPVQIFDDEPGWNCLTMGNRVCGPDYIPFVEPVTDEAGIVHTGCLIMVGETSTLVCPDGYVSQS